MIRELGSEKYLFLDYELIDQQAELALRVHAARKEGVVLRGEHPWERGIVARPSVIEYDGRYHMWYNARPPSTDWSGPGDGVLCYATSTDGVHWEKPWLGQCQWEEKRDNNIVLSDNGGMETCVFLDPLAPPEARFKLLTTYYLVHVGKAWGLYLASSADGISWTTPHRVLPFCPDTMNSAFYDESLGRYVAYLRGNIGSHRIVVRAEMDDISAPWPHTTPAWSRQRLLARGDSAQAASERLESTPTFQFPLALAADGLDPVNGRTTTDVYTPSVLKYRPGRAYFAFPAMFVRRENDPGDGPIEVQLATSRDGRRFWRPDRSPYLPLGEKADSDDGGMMFMGMGALEVDERIYQYYSARATTHSEERHHPELYPQVDGKPVLQDLGVIRRSSQDRDRFVGLTAPRGGGELITAPFTFSGRQLELDVDCGATGRVRVEILDAHGAPIWGYDLQQAEPVFLNRHRAQVCWRALVGDDTSADLSSLAGKPVRLHMLLESAQLYGMQFTD